MAALMRLSVGSHPSRVPEAGTVAGVDWLAVTPRKRIRPSRTMPARDAALRFRPSALLQVSSSTANLGGTSRVNRGQRSLGSFVRMNSSPTRLRRPSAEQYRASESRRDRQESRASDQPSACSRAARRSCSDCTQEYDLDIVIRRSGLTGTDTYANRRVMHASRSKVIEGHLEIPFQYGHLDRRRWLTRLQLAPQPSQDRILTSPVVLVDASGAWEVIARAGIEEAEDTRRRSSEERDSANVDAAIRAALAMLARGHISLQVEAEAAGEQGAGGQPAISDRDEPRRWRVATRASDDAEPSTKQLR